MGRRSLPKIDPQVEICHHLVPLETLAPPIEPQILFPFPQPLELEVGSGKGHFLLQQSVLNPDRNYLGCELSKKYARFAAYRLAKQGLPNARLVCGDAANLFAALSDSCARGVHVYFPDPWWKKRHRRRRIMRSEFVEQIQRVLTFGGELQFWTDVEEYYEQTLELLVACPNLKQSTVAEIEDTQHAVGDSSQPWGSYRTHFERRMRLHDHPVYQTRFVKS